MKLLLKILLIIVIALPATDLWAQTDTPFEKDYFPEQKDALKQAKKQIKEGDNYYEDDFPKYSHALELYLKANNFNSNNSLLNYRIAYCYLHTVQKTNGIKYLEKARQLNPKINPSLLYWLARGYHLNLEINKAIETYEEYKGSLSPKELTEQGAKIDKKIAECHIAEDLIMQPVRIFIDNLGTGVNTENPEYGPYINADETVLMFTSTRPTTTGGKTDPTDEMFFEDIYISQFENQKWSMAKNPRKPLNTDSHDAIVGVSPDGKHALIYKGEDKGGDIFECRIDEEGKWGSPKRLPKEINTKYHESSATFSVKVANSVTFKVQKMNKTFCSRYSNTMVEEF